MSSCCDSLERICIRTSGQQLNCWLDGGLKSGDRQASKSSCSDHCFFYLIVYLCIPMLLYFFMLYQYHYNILLFCSIPFLYCPLFYTTAIYTTLYTTLSIYYLGPQMPHLRKENRQLDVHSLFIFSYSFSSPFRFCSTASSSSSLLAPLSSSIALSQSGQFCPSPPPPTATSPGLRSGRSVSGLWIDSSSVLFWPLFAVCLSPGRFPATLLPVDWRLSSASPTPLPAGS